MGVTEITALVFVAAFAVIVASAFIALFASFWIVEQVDESITRLKKHIDEQYNITDANVERIGRANGVYWGWDK